ncbi:MAG: LLM class flavin-dependent oxidoreductase [Candidatus Tectomicrobia bacterium]|nr:LLM class flavin-dependent oxidoreductase [Candidatus Tectomicrobia bacterium]
MPSPRLALYLQDELPMPKALGIVRLAEECGFEAVWQAESRLSRDPTVCIAAYASTTRRIGVGTAVMNMWTRNVATMAQTFATLDDIAPGRVRLGLGAWWEPMASNVGVRRERPVAAMREIVTSLQRLFRMEKVSYEGIHVRVRNLQIDTLEGIPPAKKIPVLVGATGDKMLEMAGEVADGVLLNYFVSTDYNRNALAQIRKGCAKAGRSVESVDRPQLIVCACHENRDRAFDVARGLVTKYLGHQAHLARASGIDPGLLDEIHSIVGWPIDKSKVDRAKRLVPDDVVQKLTAAGTPDECFDACMAYLKSGATAAIVYPVCDAEFTVKALAQRR